MSALILDTSQDICHLIYTYKQTIIKNIFLKINPPLSQNLPLELSSFLHKEKISLEELSYLALAIGPGSFTGLRVGAALFQAFSYVKKKPIVPFYSLMGYVPQKQGKFTSVMSAKSNEFFILKGEKIKNHIEYFDKPELASYDELKNILTDFTLLVVPENTDLELFKNTPVEKQSYNISHISYLAWEKFQKKEYSTNSNIDLLYLKNPKA